MPSTATKPHIRLDIDFIRKYVPIIGPYGLTIYAVIKSHENGKTGACFPSYKTIARESGIDRSTVIRYVKKLKDLGLVSPEWRFKEDGSHNSNQYKFSGGRTRPLPMAAENNHPGCTKPPELSELNKKQRTITDVDFIAEKSHFVTFPPGSNLLEKQKTCQHFETAHFEEITICYHCYMMLEGKEMEIVAA